MSASSPKQVIASALAAIFALSLCVSAQTPRRARKAPAPTKTVTPAVKPEETLFKRGIGFFQGAHYEDSIITFKQLIASYPQTPFTDLAYTYAIQSMVKLELYTEASELLDKFKAAYPGSPLGASLTKEILNSKINSAASKPAIPVTPTDEANPFANMAKDAPPVDMSKTDDNASNSTSGGVPPPTTLRRNKNSDDYMTGGQTSAVPPPTGLRNPAATDLHQKNPGKNDSRRDTSAAPLPTDVAGSTTASAQRTGNSSSGGRTAST